MKVKLELAKEYPWRPEGSAIKYAKMSLPFYKSRRGMYVHRVRNLTQFWMDGVYTHSGVSFWCGNQGNVGKGGVLLGSVPDGEVLCATCEGRAIGAGQDGARMINGREVMFSPRRGDRL